MSTRQQRRHGKPYIRPKVDWPMFWICVVLLAALAAWMAATQNPCACP
jgi:hypothetical protein